jgi:hypothetical protein
VKPSLFTLFKRGRYFRLPLPGGVDSAEITRARREAERFAAAAIGFCMSHNRSFRRYFVHSVCGIELPPRAKMEIEVEPESWADLLVYLPRHIFVVEFKLGAPLQPHQDPSNKAFWENRIGYGSRIEALFKRRQKHFVVLGHSAYVHFPDRPNWTFAQPGWESVAKGFRNGLKSQLLCDLRDCLAQLGIWEFSSMKSSELRVLLGPVSVGSMAWKILWAAFTHRELKFATGVTAFRHESEWISRDSWYFGIEIQPNSNRTLANFLRPNLEDAMMWFGYECERREKDCQSLWFYCENEDIADIVEKHMQPRKFSGDRLSRRKDEKGNRTYVCIQGRARYGQSEFDWFVGKLMHARCLERHQPISSTEGRRRVQRRRLGFKTAARTRR